MARSRKSSIELTAYDDLFQTDESRAEAALSKIRDIPISEIDEFPDHPFKVLMDEDMEQLVDSIKRNGVMTPATVRLKEDGRYELISGHRRKKACELAGLDTLKCEVKEFSRDEAIIVMVESNLQRTTILPSEKAFAYKMRLEAMKRQAGRPPKENVSPMATNLPKGRSDVELGELVGESKDQIRRYIRLTELVPEILQMVDELRAQYIKRFQQPTFQSVILAGVYDIKNLKRKIRPDEEHKYNSPWNIAADFKIDMSFSADEIAEMLMEYEADHHTGMQVNEIAGWIYDYTSGYPFLVSRLCQLIDEDIALEERFGTDLSGWSKEGFQEAVRMLLTEKNTLFESLSEKLASYPDLKDMLQTLLFFGKSITYNYYEPAVNIATVFGLVRNEKGTVAVSNRIFETWMYNLFLSSADMQRKSIYEASLRDKNQFIVNGQLDMKKILERFVCHFQEIYGDQNEQFLEEEGRKYFLLYLRPIINGTGNYYIESRTRNMRRTDVIVDYLGEQYIIELKIWHGEEYKMRGEKQLAGYLDDYHKNKGYMLSFNFNKNKQIGVNEITIDGKTIVEAVV